MRRDSPSSQKRMAVDHNAGALFCEQEEEEENWAECDEESKSEIITFSKNKFNTAILPPLVFECDFFWDDEELQSLFSKERESSLKPSMISEPAPFFVARNQGVEFITRISSYHGFSTSATIVAVNFLDRFLFDHVSFERDRPWLMQLVAVACFSLAAKVEETHVPLLLDLQVEDAKYFFESKTIKRMELLILSALKWRMNPVTPLSFVDHIVRRLGFNSHGLRLEFLRSCGNLILSVISDSRSVGYFPSVLATATMLHIVHQVEYLCGNAVECENMMLDVLKISKEEVEECYGVISDVVSKNGSKRKILEFSRSSDAVTNSSTTTTTTTTVIVAATSPPPSSKKDESYLAHFCSK